MADSKKTGTLTVYLIGRRKILAHGVTQEDCDAFMAWYEMSEEEITNLPYFRMMSKDGAFTEFFHKNIISVKWEPNEIEMSTNDFPDGYPQNLLEWNHYPICPVCNKRAADTDYLPPGEGPIPRNCMSCSQPLTIVRREAPNADGGITSLYYAKIIKDA